MPWCAQVTPQASAGCLCQLSTPQGNNERQPTCTEVSITVLMQSLPCFSTLARAHRAPNATTLKQARKSPLLEKKRGKLTDSIRKHIFVGAKVNVGMSEAVCDLCHLAGPPSHGVNYIDIRSLDRNSMNATHIRMLAVALSAHTRGLQPAWCSCARSCVATAML